MRKLGALILSLVAGWAFCVPAVAGWVGVGGAVREDSRAIVFGREGASHIYAFSGQKNFGVFRAESTNNGYSWGSWSQTNLGSRVLYDPATDSSASVNALLASSTYIVTPWLLAGTSDGQVYRSTDHGNSWTMAVGLPGGPIMALVEDNLSSRVLACVSGHGIYQSLDKGQSFAGCAILTPPGGTMNFMDVDLDPNSPGDFYAVTASEGSISGGIYLWDGSGSSWIDLSTGLPLWGSRSYSLSTITVSPSEQYMWVGDAGGMGILKSVDSGSTWVQGCITCEKITSTLLAVDYSDSNQHMYFASEWGWYESSNSGCVAHFPKGLWVNGVTPDPNWSSNFTLWLATSDGIRKFGPGAFPAPPQNDNMSQFDISFIAPSPSASSDNVIYAASHRLGVFRSISGGIDFHRYMPSLAVGTTNMAMSSEITALALHPNFEGGGQQCGGSESTVYMAAKGGGVFQSSAQGSTWEPITAGLPMDAQVSTLVHIPFIPFDGNYPLFAGVNPNSYQTVPKVFRYSTQTQPGSWVPAGDLPMGEKVVTVAVPPNHDGSVGRQEVFAGTDKGLFRSINRGVSWSNTNLPGSGSVTGIVFHPQYDGSGQKTLFASRWGSGIYKSTDSGDSWMMASAGLSNCSGAPSFLWDFTDDKTWDSTGQNAVNIYDPYLFPYTWRGQVTDGGQSVQMTGTIKSYPELPPECYMTKCIFSASPSVSRAPALIEFSADAIADGGCTIPAPVTYKWDFDNDLVWDSFDQRAFRIFRSVGTHTYRLEIVVQGGSVYSFTGQVVVLSFPVCPWTMVAEANPPSGMGPLEVHFSAGSVPYLPVSSLAISPDYGSDQSLVAGLRFLTLEAMGGVYLSTDGGASWNARNTGLADFQVATLAYARAPVAGNKRLLCGTQQERAFFTDDPHNPASAWIPSQGYESTVGEIKAVAISPVPTNTGCSPWSGAQGSDIFVGGSQGVFWSNDGGETFRPINQWGIGPTSACVPEVTALFVFVNPKGPTPTGGCTGMASMTPRPMLLAGTKGQGIWYRYATQDPLSSAWDWTQGEWRQSTIVTGVVNRFTRENDFGALPLLIRAATSEGVFTSHVLLTTYGECWEFAGLTGNISDIENGKLAGLMGVQEKAPGPDAPSGSTTWGTVMGTGVQQGVQSGTFDWYERNGSGAGTLPDLNVQSIVELTDGTVLVGTTATGIYRTEDGGTSVWESSNGDDCGIGSTSKDVRDIMESSNGDVLCAVYGSGADGGVFLSADQGKHWVSISEGFGSGDQTLSSIVANSEDPPTYYAGTYTDGSYATTIQPLDAPTVTNVDVTSGSSSGGTVITITGTGFLCSCPTGYSCGSCAQTVACFGGIDGTTTACGSTSITVATPARPGGTVEVKLRNPDTRSASAGTFTFNEAEGGTFEITLDRDASDQVVVSWEDAPNSSARIYRSTVANFSTLLTEETSVSVPDGSFTYEDETGTDAYTYFYKVE